MWQPTCHHSPLEFVVYPLLEGDVAEDGILVSPDGTVTNRFADGTAGIGAESAIAAQRCETAYCPICGAEARWVQR